MSLSTVLITYWTHRLWMILRKTDEELDKLLRDDLRRGRKLWVLIRTLLFPPSAIWI